MSLPPIRVICLGGAFYPIAAHKALVAQHYAEDTYFTLAAVDDRSMASHRHFFAVVNKAFDNLPEGLAQRFAKANHLRKYCLIKAGYRTEKTIAFDTEDDAKRAAALLEEDDDFVIVTLHGCSVTRWRAESQSSAEMGYARFEASKQATLDILAEMLGVDPTELSSESERTT